MGLFDDLLKKPTTNKNDSSSTYTGGNNPADPLAGATPIIASPVPVVQIQKSDETSITTESPKNTVPSAPPPTTMFAEDDASSIIISNDSAPVSDIVISSPAVTPIVVTSEPTESENMISHIEVTKSPISHTQSTTVVNELGNLFSSDEDISPSSTSIVAETQPEDSIILGEDSLIIDTPDENNSNDIFGIAEESMTASSEIMSEAQIEEDKSLPEANAVESATLNEESPIIAISEATEVPKDTYEHPSEFITASIAKIDTMVAKIDETHSAKLEEALGYKTEKEKYTTLEETAYADAQKLVEEKDHALGMRTYFVEQGQKGDIHESELAPIEAISETETTDEDISTEPEVTEPSEITDSMETTLTGLAVQNVVTETVKTPKAKKEQVSQVKETEGILGL